MWGGSGLGKTHLMHSIGHHILKNDPAKKVLYVSSETFMNELINSISNNTSTKFRDKYRQIDVLLIDDIQFLGGKEGTQDEFFHTFNTLYEANKQIVISGDRPPEEIERLEERIRSRFKWGLIVDIKPPDYETRVAILQKKAKINELNIDLSVLSYIADNIASNTRATRGGLDEGCGLCASHLPRQKRRRGDGAGSAGRRTSRTAIHRRPLPSIELWRLSVNAII